MLPTLRLLVLVLLAAPLIAGAAFAPLLSWVAVIYLLLVGGVLISDVLLSPRPDQIEVERLHDQRLSLGAANLITVLVTNAASRPLRFTLRDEYPVEMPVDADLLAGVAEPFGLCELRYHVRPQRRGDYQFGDVVMRYEGVLGCHRRQVRFPAAQTVQVYPNLLEARKYDLVIRRGQLRTIGLRSIRQLGQGGEFEHLREYTTDDEYRRINWKATARRGKPIVAEIEAERSQHIICVIDAGRLMATPVVDLLQPEDAGLTRLDYVVNTALMLSYVVIGKGDQAGMLTFAAKVENFIPPRKGKAQFQRLLEALYNVQTQPVEADIAAALAYLDQRQQRRALVIIFTDLANPAAVQPLMTHIRRLARRHLPLCVTISDPNIANVIGRPVQDSYGLFRRLVAEQLADERRALLDQIQRSGALTLDVPATSLTVSVVNTYLRLKEEARL
ncbi:DUF58 domain-containing protein [uncultured Chloroflexus sp.]|uniref:DUF58 domain-containing protein n=1 Tax=uncultured Chloroflexus sp. TaxID=214040 RepID=UPI002604D1D3|nr:DUF58 domain-containing protein [uncultured Chloroflexus sp.]